MGELIDLRSLRRAYRILDHFVGDGLDMPRDASGQAATELIDATVAWCADWIERRGGRAPSPSERRAMRRHLVGLLERRAVHQGRG